MSKSPVKDDGFLGQLQKSVQTILDDPKTKTADRLKAIEAGAKLLTIRHRLEGGEGGQDGSFFGS
jgi:hypothetical protein